MNKAVLTIEWMLSKSGQHYFHIENKGDSAAKDVFLSIERIKDADGGDNNEAYYPEEECIDFIQPKSCFNVRFIHAAEYMENPDLHLHVTIEYSDDSGRCSYVHCVSQPIE